MIDSKIFGPHGLMIRVCWGSMILHIYIYKIKRWPHFLFRSFLPKQIMSFKHTYIYINIDTYSSLWYLSFSQYCMCHVCDMLPLPSFLFNYFLFLLIQFHLLMATMTIFLFTNKRDIGFNWFMIIKKILYDHKKYPNRRIYMMFSLVYNGIS